LDIAVPLTDGFQDSEYFVLKAEMEQLGIATSVISLTRRPIEIWSFFSRVGALDVNREISEAKVEDYDGVLVPGGAKSPATLAESQKSWTSFAR
jgi:protease I